MNSKRVSIGLIAAITVGFSGSSALASTGTPSDTADCTGWAAQGPWQSAAYGVAQVTLVQCTAPAAVGQPCQGTVVEVDHGTSCLASAGTMLFNGSWGA